MCTTQLQRHLGEWLRKSRSQFTGQNKTNRHGHISPENTVEELQEGKSRGRWLGLGSVRHSSRQQGKPILQNAPIFFFHRFLSKISLKANQTKQIKNEEEAAGRESFYVCSEL